MKKQVLLVMLFCVTVILAIIGLNTEKTMARGAFDDPFWLETGESMGSPITTTVYCDETIISTIITKEYDFNGIYVGQKTTVERTKMAIAREAGKCGMISTGNCTPSNPC